MDPTNPSADTASISTDQPPPETFPSDDLSQAGAQPFPTSAQHSGADSMHEGAAGEGGEAAPGAASTDFVDRATAAAHQTIDRLAKRARVMLDKAPEGKPIEDWRSDWIVSAREAIRERPLVALGIALAVGVVAARLRSTPSTE